MLSGVVKVLVRDDLGVQIGKFPRVILGNIGWPGGSCWLGGTNNSRETAEPIAFSFVMGSFVIPGPADLGRPAETWHWQAAQLPPDYVPTFMHPTALQP